MLLQRTNKKGFTLLELLVVIIIIVMIAAMILPSTVDLIKKRGLKGSASIIQLACLQARSQAISQRERHFVVLFTKNDGGKDDVIQVDVNGVSQSGKKNTVRVFDSNENTTDRELESLDQAEELPDFFTIDSIGGSATFNSLVLEFSPTGSVKTTGLGTDFPQGNDGVFDNNLADIIISQNQGESVALIDIIKNTGQVHFEIRTP